MSDESTPNAAEIGAKGGRARAKAMTPKERSDAAKKAVEARWSKAGKGKDAVIAPHNGVIRIGTLEIPCSVLEDGTRVLHERGIMKALGVGRSGSAHNRAKKDAEEEGGAGLPLFVAPANLKPFIDLELASVLQNPIWYRPATSGDIGILHKGVRAEILPKICNVWLKARDAGVIRGERQLIAVASADMISRGLAEVGITALVDEATGYQDARSKDALAKILESFIAKELRKWISTFPAEFYKELFRLKKIPYNGSLKRPQCVGNLTNDLVYRRLAPGVLQSLRIKNPVTDSGHRKSKHFQWFTEEVGRQKLLQHLDSVVSLMTVSDNWEQFKKMVDRAKPVYQETPLFDDLPDE